MPSLPPRPVPAPLRVRAALRACLWLAAGGAALPAQPVPPATPPGDSVVRLSEFEVSTSRDTAYRANNSVSSNRSNTPLFDTPQTITVLTEDFLRDLEMIDLNEALVFVPGLNEGEAGVGGDNPIVGRSQVLTRLLDNLPDESPNVRPDPALIERVEVIKGASSSLYGSSSAGGVVNSITKRPKARADHVATTQVGSFGLFRQTVDATGPLNRGKTLLYRLVAAYERSDSFRERVNSDRWTVLPVLTWIIRPGTSVTLAHEHLESRQTMDNGLPIFTGDTAVRLPRERFLSLPQFDYQIVKRATRAFLDHRFNDGWSLRLGYVHTSIWLDKPGGQLTGQASAVTRRQARRLNTQHIENASDVLQADAVGRFRTGPFAHRLLAGCDLRLRRNDLRTTAQNLTPNFVDVDRPQYEFAFSGPPQVLNHNTSDADLFGFFLQDHAALAGERLQLVAGLRYDTAEQRSTSLTIRTPVTYRPPEVITPRYALLWRPVPAVTLYASYGEAFQPDFSGRPIFGTDKRLDPVTGRLVEGGFKSKLAGGRLWLDVAFFRLERENIVNTDPNNTGFVLQSGLERARGHEVSFNADPWPDLTVFGGYSFTDAYVASDTNRALIGRRVQGVPRHSFTVFGKYRVRSGGLKGLGFGAGLRRVDARPGATNTTLVFPGYTVVQAQANYAWRQWALNVSVANLFDEYYWASVAAFNGNRAGTPFSWRGSLRRRF